MFCLVNYVTKATFILSFTSDLVGNLKGIAGDKPKKDKDNVKSSHFYPLTNKVNTY